MPRGCRQCPPRGGPAGGPAGPGRMPRCEASRAARNPASTVTAAPDEPLVVDDPVAARYEISVGGGLAGFADYRLEAGAVVVLHAEITPGLRRRGLGAALARAVLDDIRDRGLRIVP